MLPRCADGCLPRITKSNLYEFGNIMIFRVPKELRKDDETEFQLATRDPTIEEKSWPADEYVRKLIPEYPMPKKVIDKEENTSEKKDLNLNENPTDKKTSKTHEKKISDLGASRKGNLKETKYVSSHKHYNKGKYQPDRQQRSVYQRKNRQKRGPQLRNDPPHQLPRRNERPHQLPQRLADINPWLPTQDPTIGLNNVSGALQLGNKYREDAAHFSMPEHNASFERLGPPTLPFYNNKPFNGNAPHPINLSFGLLGDHPNMSNSFETGFPEQPPVNNSFENYSEYPAPNKSFDPNYSTYANFESEAKRWSAPWEGNSQNYRQNAYRMNYRRSGTSVNKKLNSRPVNRRWNQNSSRNAYRGNNRRVPSW